MERMGKVVWTLFYLPFVPLLAIRYTAIIAVVCVQDVTNKFHIEASVSSPMGLYAGFGIILLVAAASPVVYACAAVGGLIYRICAYFLMIASLINFKNNYRG